MHGDIGGDSGPGCIISTCLVLLQAPSASCLLTRNAAFYHETCAIQEDGNHRMDVLLLRKAAEGMRVARCRPATGPRPGVQRMFFSKEDFEALMG